MKATGRGQNSGRAPRSGGPFEGLLLCIALLAMGLILPALGIRDPFFTRVRDELYGGLITYSILASCLLIFALIRFVDRDHGVASSLQGRRIALAWLLIATICIGVFAHSGETRFQTQRRFVHGAALNGDPAVAMLGEHIVAGYRNPEFVYELIERDALAGVFITHHNVRGKTLAEVRDMIDDFQRARARRGKPPLWITTDQEGGSVSRLSPPLPRQPFLSTLLAQDDPAMLEPTANPGTPALAGNSRMNDDLAARLYGFGARQGAALTDLGVNVNFAPVVDLRVASEEKKDAAMGLLDAFSRIETRAIHRDPEIVSFAATHYARGLMDRGVFPTLKHFPGLGRVAADTHWFAADVPVAPDVLLASDWLPFRRTGAPFDTGGSAVPAMIPWTMLGHALVPALDAYFAASHSEIIVQGLLRQDWRYDGVLITDDFNMRPIILSPGGMGGAAARALNAGVDLLLISYDGENAYPVLAALLKKYRAGEIDRKMLGLSSRRLERARRARSVMAARKNASKPVRAQPGAKSQAAYAR